MEKKEIISELQFIKGVGPIKALALSQLGITSLIDMISFFPISYIYRSNTKTIAEVIEILRAETSINFQKIDLKNLKLYSETQIVGKVVNVKTIELSRFKKILKITIVDESKAQAELVFFNKVQYFERKFKEGQVLFVSGTPTSDKYSLVKFTHPDVEIIDESEVQLYQSGGIIPKYSMPEALLKARFTQNSVRNIMQYILEIKNLQVEESMPYYLITEHSLIPINEAFRQIHFPDNTDNLEKAIQRFKFEESLLFQLTLNSLRKNQEMNEKGIIIEKNTESVRKLYKQLPFKLTQSQIDVIKQIYDDFASGKPMNRLLQGDVGSGKTLVAIFTMLAAVDNGYQVAIMAPTELLAEQHYKTISKLTQELGIITTLLVGSQNAKLRKEINQKIVSGEAQIICGTHTLFQNNMHFNKLAYIVIDEQHKFGVNQRAELQKIAMNSHFDKQVYPHILVMSATPIPRTLSMTVYGDLDVSVITQMPAERKPIKTKIAFEQNREAVNEFIIKEISDGRQVYYVFPLVDKSEKLQLKSAVQYYEYLQSEVFPNQKIGLLHGQMLGYEKDDVMKAFLNKEYDILVATTIIEVGIDVPNATVIVIENAERYGLSQLHQLRGRVGRSHHQSYCILFSKSEYQFHLNKNNIDTSEYKSAIVRLKTMESTTDGFKIAETDLELRGPGDILGSQQSGMPNFKHLNIVKDVELIAQTRKQAQNILEDDNRLSSNKNIELRKTLQKYVADKGNYYRIA